MGRQSELSRAGAKVTRRAFVLSSGAALAGLALRRSSAAASQADGPIIDIHQHLGYAGRSNEAFLAHQRAMGITMTLLLPAGSPVAIPSTHGGVSNGLEARCLGNEACRAFANAHSGQFQFGANEVPDLQGATAEIERYLRGGALVIGEQKFGVECDSPAMHGIYRLAEERSVPVLMHWQFQRYNFGFERFHRVLAKYPKVNFIGHAQTWWANIDRKHGDQSVLYPKGPVMPGGLTDRYLGDYPNMYGDLSAGSGLNALTRDEPFTRDFLTRHQDRLLFGSDC
ncbi:MAG: amidohydrolase, partial [Acidobacteriota bacterium]|nr:amidohydrolase [Acidobacteriota bacterium]